MSLADNQEVEEQSGVSRLCNSILMAICVAPIVLIVCCVVLGWNEQRAVCDSRAIIQGENEVINVGCGAGSAGSGDLVMFQCDLKQEDLPQLTAGGDFANHIPNEKVVGLKTVSEMLQCVETVQSKTQKDSTGGGTTTVKTYTYSVEWRSSPVDSSGFKTTTASWQSNCGAPNPQWPSGLPLSSTAWVPKAKVGEYIVPQSFLRGVPLTRPLTSINVPGWTLSSNTYFRSLNAQNGIGDMRASFAGNDWNSPEMTVLGLNTEGTIGQWSADDSWMCSGFTVGTLRAGVVSKEDLFAALRGEASATTWILRVVFLLLMWCGFSMLFKPLEVAADCIPCIGPCLGDSVSAITCCISLPMACACGMGVIGFMWVFMRPLVGVPLILIFCCTFGAAIGFKVYTSQNKKGGDADPEAGAES